MWSFNENTFYVTIWSNTHILESHLVQQTPVTLHRLCQPTLTLHAQTYILLISVENAMTPSAHLFNILQSPLHTNIM